MKTIGQVYPLSKFEPGDVGAFVVDGNEGWPFVVTMTAKEQNLAWIHTEREPEGYPKQTNLCNIPARYLGRGRIQPARIVMEDA